MTRCPTRAKSATQRKHERRLLTRITLLLFGGIMLVCGFVYAGRQHVSAIKLGEQTEALRRERTQLLDEQHRLILAREQAASPSLLEDAARAIGMQQLHPWQIGAPKIDECSLNHAAPQPNSRTAHNR